MKKIHEQPAGQLKATDSEKILLVEDNMVNTEVAIDMLETLGIAVDFAKNGQRAVDLYREKQYVLILMDCEMPVMNGFDASIEIRKIECNQQRIQTPIIALSAHTISGSKEKCIACGMNDYLAKPFSMAELHLVLNKWLSSDVAGLAENHVNCSEEGGNNTTADTIANVTTESVALDYEVLDKIRKRHKKDDFRLVHRLVNIYLDQTSSLLVELKEMSMIADIDSVKRIAHTLKSSSMNVGAIGLSELCREVELICEQGKIDNSLIQKIYATYSDVEKALNDVLDNIKTL